MKVTVLGSSSRGNATLVRCGGASVLVDAGLSLRTTVSGLAEEGLRIEDLSAVLVTHTHIDHVRALPAIAGGGRVVSTPGNLSHLPEAAPVEGARHFALDYGESVRIGSMTVRAFPVPHDCKGQPCGFTLSGDGVKIGIATDVGHVTDAVVAGLKGCTGLVMESNHDADMLFNSSRPPWLIGRIMGPQGHLSNAECAEGLERLVDSGTKWVMLAHLSQECNRRDLALREAEGAIGDRGAEIYVSKPDLPTKTKDVVRDEGPN